MILAQIVVQATAANTAGAVRVSLQPGYNFIQGDPLLAAQLAAGLAGTVYPDSPFESILGDSGQLRIRFQNNDGAAHRIDRDLDTDTTILLAERQPDGAPERLAGNPAEIGQRLRTEERLPSFHAFREIYLGLRQADAPDGGGAAGAREGKSGPGVVPAAHLSSVMRASAGGGRSTTSRLELLRSELASSGRAEAIEYELEGLRQELFRLEDRHRKVVDAEQRLQELERRLSELPDLSELAEEGVEQRLEELELRRKSLDIDLERLAQDHERRKDSGGGWTWGQVFRDPGIVGGTLLGLFFFVMAAVIGGGARFLAVGSMVGFGLAAFSLWRFVGEQERRLGEQRRIRVVEERWHKLAAEREAVADEERVLLGRHDGLDPEERQRLLDERGRVQSARDDLAGRLDTVRGSQVFRHFEQRRQELKARQGELEGELGGLGGLSAVPSEIKREIERLEQERNGGGPDGSAAQPGPVEAGGPPETGAPVAGPAGPAEVAEDPLRQLCARAGADLLFEEPEAVAARIQDRLGTLLGAFTSGRCTGVQLTPGGGCRSVDGPQGSRELAELDPQERAGLEVATRIALAEASQDAVRAPFLVGGELDGATDAWLALEMLKGLAGKMQLLHVTCDPQFTEAS